MSSVKHRNSGDVCRIGGDLLMSTMNRQNGGDLLNVHPENKGLVNIIFETNGTL